MAFSGTQKTKQQYLFTVLAIVAIIGAIWFLLPKVSPDLPPLPPAEARKIDIKIDALKNPALEKLNLFEEISPFEGEGGRENPFLPY